MKVRSMPLVYRVKKWCVFALLYPTEVILYLLIDGIGERKRRWEDDSMGH